MNREQRYAELKKTSIVTIIINFAMAALKAAAGVMSGSVAVISDAVHTGSDVFTTLMVLVGLKFSSAGADEEHPYGHQRIESLISFLLAFILALTALYLGYKGIVSLIGVHEVEFSLPAVIVTSLSIVFKEWMFR
jgi:cation diffusion facilitator family transporter